ncbi:BamA/TamA family outer membrane protein [candidate division WOR-3 bacterium]|nr:BamA/TamA family outer membrane protein [candidate division WOR-3 bacterium]
MIVLLIPILIFNTPVKKVGFTGNKTVSSRTLRHHIFTQKGSEYNELNITYDCNEITTYYETQGFFYTEISPSVIAEEKGIKVTYAITEGLRKEIEILVINGTTRDSIGHLLRIKEGDFFIQSLIRSIEDSIETFFQNRGFPFASVKSFVLPDSAILMINVDKGTSYYIRDITIQGLTICNPRVIHREIEIKKGALFVKRDLIKSQQNIYSLGFISTVDVELNKHSDDTLDIVFNVRELKSRILNFGIGLSTPLDFLFSFGIEELNLFNIGHRFQIRPSFQINIDQEWTAKFESRYAIPHITDLRLTISILPFIWYEHLTDYNLQTRGNELRVSKLLTNNILMNIANRYKHVELDQKTGNLVDDSVTGITNSLTGQLVIDSRDDFFNPYKGMYIVPAIEFAGGPFGGKNDFIRGEIETRLFLFILGNTIAQRVRVGYIHPLNGVAFYELYFLGGQYSIRGYPERSLGPQVYSEDHYGRALANYNIECRFHLPLNFGLVGFFDCGYINNEFNLDESEFLKAGAGAGLRYYTPIGPARLDIGFPLDGEYDPALYFGIYHIF